MSNTATARKGDWVETSSGKEFWPLDPRPEEIDINDIAHALSMICRFNGHTRHHYSVAQHSLNCSIYAKALGHGPKGQLYCLLHDASEAYICDIPRPLKPYLINYTEIEDRLQAMIYERFGLPSPTEEGKAHIKEVDNAVLMIEAKALLTNAQWAEEVDRRGIHIVENSPAIIESAFLHRFQLLINEIQEG